MDFKQFLRNVNQLKVDAELKGYNLDELTVMITKSRGDILICLRDHEFNMITYFKMN